jgi:uncharacterized protein (DUF1015 family)
MLSADQTDFPEFDPLSFTGFIGGLPSSLPREEAASWLRQMIKNKTLRSTGAPSFLIYELTMEGESAIGLVGEIGIDAYDSGHIKRHEETRSETETGLSDRLAAVRANGSPVALAHRSSPAIEAAISECSAGSPDLHFVASDGVTHSLWIVTDPESTRRIGRAFADLESLYITDGHHRMAAAARLARYERAENPNHDGSEPYNYAVAALFSADQLRLRAFTRCVMGGSDHNISGLVSQIERSFSVEPTSAEEAEPRRRGEFGMVVDGQGYRIVIRNSDLPKDPYRSLDVVFLQEHVLGPTFGITDPRSDARLHFVSDRVQPDDVLHEHCWAWFKPFPATVSDVMAVADHGLTMPPKSTWFEPKLPTGLVVRLLD